MKSKSAIYFIFLIIILALGGFYFYYQKANKAMAPTENFQNQQPDKTNSSTNISNVPPAENKNSKPGVNSKSTTGTFSTGNEGENIGPDILVVEVDYNGTDFTPEVTNIKVGDIVIFKNKSSSSFWPASNPHPAHTDYPEFDAKTPIPAGGKYQFKFEKAGNWGFHDHLNPSARGVVNVSQ